MRTWGEYAWQRAHARALISRLINSKLTLGFNTWAELASDRASAHDAAERVIRRFMAQHLSKGFTTFVEYSSTQKEQYDKMRSVVSRFNNAALTKAWASWKEVGAAGRRTLDFIAHSAARFTSKYNLAALKCWWIASWMVKDERRTLKRWQYVLASGEFERAAQLMMMEKCVQRLNNLTLSKYFSSMVRTLEMEMALAVAIKKLTQMNIAKCLHTWIERVHGEQDEASAYEKAFRRLRNQEASKAWAQWSNFTNERLTALSQLDESMIAFRRVTFGWAMDRYKEHVEYLIKVRYAMQRLREADVARAITTWTEYAVERAEVQEQRQHVLASLLNTKVAMAWRTWNNNIEAALEQRAAIKEVVGAFLNQKESKAFNKWHEVVEEEKEKKNTLRSVVSGFRNAKVGAVWRTWRGLLVDRKGMANAVGFLVNMHIGRAYNSWRSWVEEEIFCKKMFSRFRSRGLIAAWNSWNEYVEELQTNHTTLMKLINVQSGKAFRRWVEYGEEMETQRITLMRLFKVGCTKALLRWVEYLDEVASQRRMMRRMMNQQLAQGFEHWASAGEKQAEQMRMLTKAVSGILSAQLLKGFNSWVWINKEMKLAYQRLRVTLNHKAVAALHRWQEAVEEIQRSRQVILSLLDQQLAKSLRTWLAYAEAVADSMEKLQHAMAGMLHRELFKGFGSWKGVYEAIKQAKRDKIYAKEMEEARVAMEAAAAAHAEEQKRLMAEAQERQKALGTPGNGALVAAGHSPLQGLAGRNGNSVVVLSARPRTVMERSSSGYADTLFTTSSCTGGRAVPFGAPKTGPSRSLRRRAWEVESKIERSTSALDSGRLPTFGGGRHTSARAEERHHNTWGSKMASSQRIMSIWTTMDPQRAGYSVH